MHGLRAHGHAVAPDDRRERARADDGVRAQVQRALVALQRGGGLLARGSRRARRCRRRACVSRNCSTETSQPKSPRRSVREPKSGRPSGPSAMRVRTSATPTAQVLAALEGVHGRGRLRARRSRRSGPGTARVRAARPAAPRSAGCRRRARRGARQAAARAMTAKRRTSRGPFGPASRLPPRPTRELRSHRATRRDRRRRLRAEARARRPSASDPQARGGSLPRSRQLLDRRRLAEARAREHDELGALCGRRGRDHLQRRVRAEEEDPPPPFPQGKAEDDEREVVQVARRAGQQGERPDALVPPRREREQAATQEMRGEVLLRDRYLAARPADRRSPAAPAGSSRGGLPRRTGGRRACPAGRSPVRRRMRAAPAAAPRCARAVPAPRGLPPRRRGRGRARCASARRGRRPRRRRDGSRPRCVRGGAGRSGVPRHATDRRSSPCAAPAHRSGTWPHRNRSWTKT